jgi:hypothetical protein
MDFMAQAALEIGYIALLSALSAGGQPGSTYHSHGMMTFDLT